MWDVPGRPDYRQRPFALCYKSDPGETVMGISNELVALATRMTVREALETLSYIEIDAFLNISIAGRTLLEDDPILKKIRVWVLDDPPHYYLTQAAGEFPVAWQRSETAGWKPLDQRIKIPSRLTGSPSHHEEAASDRMDALEFVDAESVENLVTKGLKPTFTSIPQEAAQLKSVPAALAEALRHTYAEPDEVR